MQDIVELRSFLRALCRAAKTPTRIPALLRALARRVARGDEQRAHDLLSDVCVDLLERRGQVGSVENLLDLSDLELRAAVRWRLIQMRAVQAGSRARLVKALRAHVAAALASSLPVVESLPTSLMSHNRLDAAAVRSAVAFLGSSSEGRHADIRTTATELMSLYFETSLLNEDHPLAPALDDAVAGRIDAHEMADRLRALVGPAAVDALGRRARGLSLTGGGVAASTEHGRLVKALTGVKALAQQHDLAPPDFDSLMEVLAA